MGLFQLTDIPRILPELLLLLLAIFVIGSDVFERWSNSDQVIEERARAAGQLAAVGLGLVVLVTLVQSRLLFTVPEPGTNPILNILINFGRNLQSVGTDQPALIGAFAIDQLTMIARLLFASAALVVTLVTMGGKTLRHPAEFYGLMLFATLGLTVMAGSVDLILAYIALELSSLALYVLAGYLRDDERSTEAGVKYFLFGAISSAMLLYGMSLAYGFAASESAKGGTTVIATLFSQIGQSGVASNALSPLVLVALVFIIAGLGYKIAATPFHSWAPDVYQGAPPVVTMLIATASKTAGFLLLYRMLTIAFPNSFGSAEPSSMAGWAALIALIAAATVLLGNLAALLQTSTRRMLAYSGIGHTGFMLLALTLAGTSRAEDQTFATAALLTYLTAYIATSLVAFGVLSIVVEATGGDEVEHLRGLWKRNTPLAAMLSISLLSLAGIPPLSGFWAKLLVFMAAYRGGAIWLVALALAMTVVALAYYLRVLRVIWSSDTAIADRIRIGRGQAWTLGIVAGLIVLLGLVPGPLWSVFETVVK